MAEVICVGSAVLDHIYDVPTLSAGGGTLFAHGYRQAGTGNAANAAVSISRLGGRAVLWSRLGSDETGDLILADLARYGVDVARIRRFDTAQSPISTVIAAADGQRLITRFETTGLPDAADWLRLDRIQDTSAVLADPHWPAAAQAALKDAREHRIPGILAVDAMPKPVSPDLADSAGYIVFSPTGLAQFTGHSDPETGLAEAARLTQATIGVTSGTDGFRWINADGALQFEPALPEPPVDPAIALDVFCGAFALATGEEKDIATAVRFAVTAAGLAAGTRLGGRQVIPDRATVWQRLEEEYGQTAGAGG